MQSNKLRPLAIVIATAAVAVVFAADPAPPAAVPKGAAPAAPSPDEVVATVGGEPIKRAEVDAAIGKVLAQRGMPADAIPAGQREMITRSMVDDLVIEKLLGKASAGMKVSDAEVDAEFADIRKNFPGSDEELAKQLAEAGLTLDTLKGEIRDRTQKRKWIDEQVKGKFEVPGDAAAKEFYDKNPQHFEQPELVRASHILFRLEQTSSPAEVTAALKKAEGAIERAKKEEFGGLAGELSEEPGAKERGGDLNFFPRTGAMVEPFAEAAFKLKKGEVSTEPVRTQFGYHVIKVTDRKDAVKQPFDEAKTKIVEYLGRDQKNAAIGALIEDLKKNGNVEIKLPPPAPQPAPAAATPPAAAPGAKPARKPVEAVTPPVSVPAAPAEKK